MALYGAWVYRQWMRVVRRRWGESLLLAGALIACGPADDVGGRGGGAGMGGNGGQDAELPAAGAQLLCPPGELPLGDGACRPAGVPPDGCGIGFIADDSGCVADVPATPCASGTYALPGETTCHEVESCGAGPWGDFVAEASTQFVDGTFAGVSDGTMSAPWQSIDAAIAAAAPGAIVALAAGHYVISVGIDKAMRIWGHCPALTSIENGSVTAGASGLELHDLAITNVGLLATNVGTMLLERVWLHDLPRGLQLANAGGDGAITVRQSLFEATTVTAIASDSSIVVVEDTAFANAASDPAMVFGAAAHLSNSTTATFRRVSVTDIIGSAIVVDGSHLEVEDSLVTRVEAHAAGLDGVAFVNRIDSMGISSTLSIARSVVSETTRQAVLNYDSDASIRATVLADVAAEAASGSYGHAVAAYYWASVSSPPVVELSQSLIERAHSAGVHGEGAIFDVESLLVRDTQPEENLSRGRGFESWSSPTHATQGQFSMRGCHIDGGHEIGLLALGSHAIIEDTLVENVNPQAATGIFGGGLAFLNEAAFSLPSTGVARRTVSRYNHAAGMIVIGSDATLEDVWVHDTKLQQLGNDFGDGIAATAYWPFSANLIDTSITVVRATVERSARAAVAGFGSDIAVGESLMLCSQFSLVAEAIDDTQSSFTNLGDNVCGCDDNVELCKVSSGQLDPPLSL
jgi:hypothetical protein